MIKKVFVFLTFLSIFLYSSIFAAEQTVPVDFNKSALSFSIGRANPESHESPWLPITQLGFRTKLTAKFSSGTIALKFPIRVNFTYDELQAEPGKTLKLKVSSAPIAPSGALSFESLFGLHLGSTCEVGFVGLSGIPDIMPWFNINYNIWDLISQVPKVGAILVQLKDQIDISMTSSDPLPLGTSVSYHDQREIIDITNAMLNDSAVKASILTKLKSKIPAGTLSAIKDLVKYYKSVDDAGADQFIDGVLEKVLSQFSLKLVRDPSYTVEGEKITVNLKYGFPARGGWSTYPVNLTSTAQTEEINIGIPAFCNTSDKLEIKVTGLTYEFKLKQKLAVKLTIPILGEITLGETSNKVIAAEQVYADITDHVLNVDIRPSTTAILNYYIKEGCTSATAFWASPNIPLKGTVKLYNSSGQLLQTQTEPNFSTSHGVTFLSLTPNTPYTFKLTCVDSSGNTYMQDDKTATTKGSGQCTGGTESATDNSVTISNVNVTSTHNSLNFKWNTNVDAASVVFLSESPDFKTNYSSIIRKTGGVACKDFFSQTGDYALTKTHDITATGPNCYNIRENTMFYYTVRSYAWRDNDTTNANKFYASPGVVGSIMTPYNNEPATGRVLVKDQATNGVLANIPVKVQRGSNPSNFTIVSTGADGYTPLISYERGVTNTISVSSLPCYSDGGSSITPGAGSQPDITISLSKRPPSDCYVFDGSGNAVVGATVELLNRNKTTTTVAGGKYNFSGLTLGTPSVKVSKTGYLDSTVGGVVGGCGNFTAPDVVLRKQGGELAVFAKINTNGTLTPLSQASVTIKEGNNILTQGLVTSGDGSAIFSHNFSDDQVHNVTVTVTPSSIHPNVLPQTATGYMSRNSQNQVTVICQRDTNTPQITGLRIKQLKARILKAIFDTGEESIAAVEFKGPTGSSISTYWTTTYSTNAQIEIPLGTIGPGIIKVKAKAKDRSGNQIDSGFIDFELFGGSSWQLKATAITNDSARIAWLAFPSSDGFGKYILKVKNLTTQQETSENITSISTITKQLKQLTAGTSYEVTISAKASDNNDLADPQTITFSTRSLPPQIQGFSITPKSVALAQDLQVNALINDPDTNITSIRLYELDGAKQKNILPVETPNSMSVNFNRIIKFNKSGTRKVFLEAKDESGVPITAVEVVVVMDTAKPVIAFGTMHDAFLNIALTPSINVTNINNLTGDISGHIDWGDGSKDDFDLGQGKKKAGASVKTQKGKSGGRKLRSHELNHFYKKAGSYNISVVASIEEDSGVVSSDPIQKTVAVLVRPALVELTANSIENNPNLWKIDYKVIQGSLPVKSWNLDFGDSHIVSGVDTRESQGAGMLGSVKSGRDSHVSVPSRFTSGPVGGKGEANGSITHLFKVKGVYKIKLNIEDGSEVKGAGKELTININRNWIPEGGVGNLRDELGGRLTGDSRESLRVSLDKESAGASLGTRVGNVAGTVQGSLPQPSLGENISGPAHIVRQSQSRQITAESAQQQAVIQSQDMPVDLSIIDVRAAGGQFFTGANIDVEVLIKNSSKIEVRDIIVILESEDGFKDQKSITINSKSQERVRFVWSPKKVGRQRLSAAIKNSLDSNERNNSQYLIIEVKDKDSSRVNSIVSPGRVREESVGVNLRDEIRIKADEKEKE